ncbi:MAG: alpha-galactosidase [Candidatus Omnitrophica bacterium]|nr:alpha-galactosidase [Candidatus Omnitrophota bacterium]
MKKIFGSVLALLIVQSFCALSYGVEIGALTVFGCDANGAQDGYARWNTGPVDACWDLFVYEGDIVSDPGQAKWLNDSETRLIQLSPKEGKTTYTFHFDSDRDVQTFGLNLFGADRRQAILSVYAPVTIRRDQASPFQANRSGNTMGWPLSSIAAAGSLSSSEAAASLWIHNPAPSGQKCMITDFKILSPEAAGHVDFVGSSKIEPSGRADYVGQFTIEVKPDDSTPPDWLLWAATAGGMKIGPNNQDGTWASRYDIDKAAPPFSFVYDGRPSGELLKDWTFEADHERLDETRISHALMWTDPKTGLKVRWEGLEYTDFESIEWTLYLQNTGEAETPIIQNIDALDVEVHRGRGSEYTLHHWKGTEVKAGDYAPQKTLLNEGKKIALRPGGGRMTGTAGEWPYYNLDAGSEGIILAIGWPGRWAVDFERDGETGLRIRAGQDAAHFKLLPGETVRTPLIVMQFWKDGDWIDGQNVWRQWMIQHNIPRRNGEPLPLPMMEACSSHQFAEMTKANERSQIEFIDSYLAKGFQLDYWWMDAGWYVGAAEKGWPWTGTWEVDRREHRFPNGLRAVSDHAHSKGVDIIVWFEPERVAGGTWLATTHPEWILGGSNGGLLNLGDPEAWDWLVNHIDKIITEEGIDLYRQDYNIDPWPFWEKNDSPDRRGITENKYVTGYLAYWDELRRRHPGMVIDSCASGGHRNDLETMRRAVPLLRSDYLFEPVGQQGQTYGLSFWIPFHGTAYCPSNTSGWGWGTGANSYEPYTRRSNMCPSNNACFDFRVDVDDELLMKLYHEWLEIGSDYFGDYYPLTDYNMSPDDWLAWQFYRPEAGEGFVQAFRRDECIFSKAQLPLRGLDAGAVYRVKNYDESDSITATGKELMEKGLSVEIPRKPGAATIKLVKLN